MRPAFLAAMLSLLGPGAHAAAGHCAKTSACPGERIGVVGRLAWGSASRTAASRVAARRAIAYHAGGKVLKPQPHGAPVPCGMQTGFAGGESAIAVTNSGAVFYAPAVQSFAGTQAQYFLGGNSGFALTTNLGRTWNFVLPISSNLDVPGNPLGKPGWPARSEE